MKAKLWASLLLAAAVATGSYFAAFSGPWSSRTLWAQGTTAKPTATVPAEAASVANDLSRTFRLVHNAVKDAVVNIDTSRKMPVAARGRSRLPFRLPPGFEDQIPLPDDTTPTTPGGRLTPYGTGSGVLVSPDGYILTNNHVVEDADEITVRFDDNQELKAKVIGRDPKTDLAVIKIDGKDFTYAKFGDSDAMDVGDWVLAFGSPFGFDQSMTQGIISATGRQVNIIGSNNPGLQGLTYENFLQTDAAINPGNSGGPLVNMRGEVIGINTAIASRSGSYNGIGFAIPANEAKYVMDSLIKNGKVVRGYMGVGIEDVRDPKVRVEAKTLGYTGKTGVLVHELMPGSPGAKGGLKLGDVITGIDGKPVETMAQLRERIARTAPGSNITLQVFRDDKTQDLTFAAGTQPETATPVARAETPAPAEPSVLKDLGITVTDGPQGVIISRVTPDGLGDDEGLQKGDTIVSVQNKAVKTVEELKAALGKAKLATGVHLTVRGADGSERLIYIQRQ